MGVPLPHLVLPLSECLSRRTPTRATRGEARGHRSVLAQNSLLMYPLLFLSLDLSSICCVLAIWWAGTHVFALLWLHSCLVSFDGVTLWTCGSPKGTQHDGPGCACCLCIASRCGCRPASGMSTPSRCRALVHSQMSMVSRPSWAQWFCEVGGWQSRSSGPQWLPQRVGGLGRMRVRFGCISWCICVVAVMGLCDWRVGTAWRHTPVIHDDPDCPPNRGAFTLTGPSPNLRCWFGKGTPLIAAKPLSWVSPCLTSCCHCRGA